MMFGIKLNSHLTQALDKNIDYIQHKRAKKLANEIIHKQTAMIKSIKRLPPEALVTQNKYKKVKNDYSLLLHLEQN